MKEQIIEVNRKEITENKKNKKQKIIEIIIYICVFIFLVVIMYKYLNYKNKEDATLKEANIGTYEISTETIGYIIRNENVISYDTSRSIIPTAKEKERITVGSIVAIYKTAGYEAKEKYLETLDLEINNKLSSIGTLYSNELNAINTEIDKMILESKSALSHLDVTSYKNKLDELVCEKAKITASLTPNGDEILTLLSERESYSKEMESSSENVKTDVSGILMYSLDGNENKYKIEENTDVTEDMLKSIIEDYSKDTSNNFGMKIIDNYNAYIAIKVTNENEEYMTVGKTYKIEIADKGVSPRCVLIKVIEDSNDRYCIFKINTYIEYLLENRKADLKVVWKTVEGFIVDNSSIQEENGISYVTILSLNEYIKIPVKVILKLENVSYINNYESDELEELGIERNRKLIRYDMIVKH